MRSSRPTHILLVEDNPGDACLIREMLREMPEPGFSLEWRESLSEASRYLLSNHPDVILLDLGLPDAYGLEALEAARNLAGASPVVVFTAIDDERLAHLAMKAGAQDYLVKGQLNGDLLRRSMRYALDRHHRETELRVSEARIRSLLEACLIGIVLADPTGQILEANQAFLNILGLTLEEVAGGSLKWDDLVPEEGQDFHLRAMEAVRAGQIHPPWEVDFLRKDGTPVPVLVGAALMEAPALGFVAYVMDISERRAYLEQLQREARQDLLTGLRNRRGLLEILEPALRGAQRYGHPFCLCLCDLDGFKQINDTHGHGAGDLVLQKFGELLAEEIRGDDVPARLGGDEFCILFGHLGASEARHSVERLRARLESQAFRGDQGEAFYATATFGLADLEGHMNGPQALFMAADAALYRAKKGGRNRVESNHPA